MFFSTNHSDDLASQSMWHLVTLIVASTSKSYYLPLLHNQRRHNVTTSLRRDCHVRFVSQRPTSLHLACSPNLLLHPLGHWVSRPPRLHCTPLLGDALLPACLSDLSNEFDAGTGGGLIVLPGLPSAFVVGLSIIPPLP